jgi:hypothetical protein
MESLSYFWQVQYAKPLKILLKVSPEIQILHQGIGLNRIDLRLLRIEMCLRSGRASEALEISPTCAPKAADWS